MLACSGSQTSDDDDDDDCSRGERGCECKADGTCDGTLVCNEDDECVKANSGTGGGAGDPGAGGSSAGGSSTGGSSTGGAGSSGSGGGGSGGDTATGGTGGDTGTGGASAGMSGAAGSSGAPSCSEGRSPCSTDCVDLLTHPAHCGSCDNACPDGVCEQGQCVENADCTVTPCTGFSYCDLVDRHCKPGCAQNPQCAAEENCNLSTHACDCDSGYNRCNGVCRDENSTDACGESCSVCTAPANATPFCDGGCDFTCNSGYERCGDTCYSTSTLICDVASCQSCTTTVPYATASCDGSTCSFACTATDYVKCGGACARKRGATCATDANCCAESGDICDWWGTCSKFKACNVVYQDCPDEAYCDPFYRGLSDYGMCQAPCSTDADCQPAPEGKTARCRTSGATPICELTCASGLDSACPNGMECFEYYSSAEGDRFACRFND
jgi:hypothetical protein